MTQTVVLQYTAEPNVSVIIAEVYALVTPESYIEDLYSEWDALGTTYEITVLLDDLVAAGVITQIEALETAETGTLTADKAEMLSNGSDSITVTWVPDNVLWTDIDVDVNGSSVTIAVGDPLVVTSTLNGKIAIVQDGTTYARPVEIEAVSEPVE